ncbi:MAG: hypothetical protein WA688_06165 [Thermoplasmata archaeon]
MFYWRDEPDRMEESIARFRPLLEKSPHPGDRAALLNSLTLLNWRRHHGISDEGLEYARLSYETYLETGDPEQIAWALFMRGFAFFWHGEPKPAKEYLEKALREGERMRSAHLVSRASTYLMAASRCALEIDEAKRLIPQVLAAADTAGLPEYSAMAYATESWVAWRGGDYQKAVDRGERALKIWGEVPNRYPCDWMAIWPLVAILLDRHDASGALDLARALLHPSQQPPPLELSRLIREAVRLGETGDLPAAGRALAKALEVARELHYA